MYVRPRYFGRAFHAFSSALTRSFSRSKEHSKNSSSVESSDRLEQSEKTPESTNADMTHSSSR